MSEGEERPVCSKCMTPIAVKEEEGRVKMGCACRVTTIENWPVIEDNND